LLYLDVGPTLVALLAVNAVAVLVGIRFYLPALPAVSTWLWPLFADSPVALLLAMFSLATLLPSLGSGLDVPVNRPLAYLHTLAFVWLVKMGLWAAVALNLGFDQYFPAPWDYFGIVLTHLAFLAQAGLLPHYARTTRGALALALVLALLNDALDYGLGLHPPLRYEPGLLLPTLTVLLSVGAVALASRLLPRLGDRTR
jgi:uncharacterized membrane protein YpjA